MDFKTLCIFIGAFSLGISCGVLYATSQVSASDFINSCNNAFHEGLWEVVKDSNGKYTCDWKPENKPEVNISILEIPNWRLNESVYK